MTFPWILLGVLYFVCWVFLGLATFRNGHYWLFLDRFLFSDLVDLRGIDRADRSGRGTSRRGPVTALSPGSAQELARQPAIGRRRAQSCERPEAAFRTVSAPFGESPRCPIARQRPVDRSPIG